MDTSLSDCALILLPRISDSRGSLSFVEIGSHVPFHAARLFYLYGMPRNTVRGGHAHRECAEFLIAPEGEFEITLHDGVAEQTFLLSQPDRGLHIPSGLWISLRSLTDRGIVTALASAPYLEADYLRTFDEFLAWKREQVTQLRLAAGPLLLRSYQVSDAASFSQSAIRSAAEVGQWLAWCTPAYDEAVATRYIRDAACDRLGRKAFSFGIFQAGEDGCHLGGVALNRIDWAGRCANLGYWVATHAAGRGVGSLAAERICRFGFEELGLARIEILVEVGNAPSRAVALRIGARPEGILRNRLQRGGTSADAELFSLLPGELTSAARATIP